MWEHFLLCMCGMKSMILVIAIDGMPYVVGEESHSKGKFKHKKITLKKFCSVISLSMSCLGLVHISL